MKSLSIDIETFSSVDLNKCGVYKYAESPDFQILLFGYSVDGDEVQVVNCAKGEKIPAEILDALTDEKILKWGFNASFERVCLSKYLGIEKFLNPESWRCTMIWSAYLGLPFSLANVGKVLGLEEQKLSEGKHLIKYFCVPNQSGERNLPDSVFYEWEQFKNYNRRDVEVELAIQKRLKKYPVPDFVWKEYTLDQKINDRGIFLDMKLVKNAIEMDKKSREKLEKAMQELTNIENPNSVSQMKSWLAENGLETETLDKKAVSELLKTAPEPLRTVLTLRQQISKSSVKKYLAMQNTVCTDGRARGMFQFYGANRTGRWCLTGDHEILTKDGWCRLDEWNGGYIAVWNSNSENISFQSSNAINFEYEGKMYTYKDSSRIDQCSTPDHKMRVQRRYGATWEDMTVENMSRCRPAIPINGYRYHRGCVNPAWLRVLIMTQADGFYTADGSVMFNFKKKRKIAHCKNLLRKAEIMFTTYAFKDVTRIAVPARAVPLWLRQFRTKTFGFWLLDENPDIFFDELPNWDGYYPAPNSIQYSTCNKQNADIVQALAHMSGRAANIRIKHQNLEKHPNWKQAYVVDIWLTPKNCHEIRTKPEISDFKGKVYCAETSTGYFLVRRNGKVWITGNSGRNIQLQNLPQNHLKDLEQARELVKRGDYKTIETLYESVIEVLSELIRTAFIPQSGKKFIVADFSAIEARVLSWLAGETWRMNVFAKNGDIYCETASRMFHCKVEKHGENSHLRQKGKQAELACIAEGQLVLTDMGLVPIEKVTTEHRLWDGEEWVTHEGVIFKGEREVISYEGLTATSNHLVWIEGKSEPVQFGIAAACGTHLIQAGNGRKAIRLGKNYKFGKTLEQENESLLCADAVSRLREYTVAKSLQLEDGKIERLSELLTTSTNSDVVGQKTNNGKTALSESEKSRISELWSEGDKIRVSECYGGRIVSHQKIWNTVERNGVRSHRQQRQLCGREFAICATQSKSRESANYGSFGVSSKILALCGECGNKEIITGIEQGRNNSRGGNCGIHEEEKLENNKYKARLYDIRNAGKHHRFTVSGKLVHNCGYGGSVGALKAFGALESGMKEDELKPLVDAWRETNPNIVQFWYDVDEAAITCVKEHTSTETHGLKFICQSGMMFIELPSGRRLSYVKPLIEKNKFGGESITYMGVGNAKRWERLETYGAKLVENITQAISRDILCHAMKNFSEIVAHIHDEIVIEFDKNISVKEVCERMSKTPEWAEGLNLRSEGFECEFYKKD